ncbi:YHS domain-containing (seleno)protein [Brevundimonas sp. BR2-1]|uniref:YHS domain-containing (seleno)protein n=1 Tax=Brevundimonas sp. BR2-1 TaxID=3031123 RepID=UPI0030972F7B
MNRRLFSLLLASAAVSPAVVSAKTADKPPIDVSGAGLALRGYDAVSYHLDGRPAEGNSAHEFEWKNATWRFATAENLTRFRADPERHAPQFGGYCAWAVSQGYIAPGDPLQWRIVEGQLFLNFNARAKALWEQDIEGAIMRGRANWPQVLKVNQG